MQQRFQFRLLWLTIAVIVAVGSAHMDLNYDEGVWVTVGRRFLAGDQLYRETFDHKSPPILVIAGLLDLLPGHFELGRAVLVGSIVAMIGALTTGIARNLGVAGWRATVLGFVIAALAAIQGFFVLTVEMVGVVLVMAALLALVRGRVWLSAVLVAVAVFTEPRLLFALPALAVMAWETGDRRRLRSFLILVGALGLVGIGLLLDLADLRFWLLEMPAVSRLTFQPSVSARALTVGRSVLSTLVVIVGLSGGVALSGRRPRLSSVVLFGGTLGMVLLSRYGFPRYWMLLLPGTALVAMQMSVENWSGKSRTIGRIAALAALLPWLFVATALFGFESGTYERDQTTATYLQGVLSEGETFVAFVDSTQLPALLPGSYGLPTPALTHFTFKSSRQAMLLEQLGRRIDSADVVVIDPDVPKDGQLAPVWSEFSRRLSEFPCLGDTLYEVRFRSERCQSPVSGG